MPDDVREVYEGLSQELAWLYAKWNVFYQLFAVSLERIAFLTDIAPSFFGMLQRVYIDDIVLSLGRLTDPPRTAGRENLSLPRLLEVLSSSPDSTFRAHIQSSIEQIQVHCEPFRKQRNRRIAHKDLPTALNIHPEPLPAINRKMIEDALRMAANLLNSVLGHFENSQTAYASVILRDDGDAIVSLLEQAKK